MFLDNAHGTGYRLRFLLGLFIVICVFSGCSKDKPTADSGILSDNSDQLSVAARFPELKDKTPAEAIAAYEAAGLTGNVSVHYNGNCTAGHGSGKVFKQEPRVNSTVDSSASVALYTGCFDVEIIASLNGSITPFLVDPAEETSVAGVFNMEAYNSLTFKALPDPGCETSEVLIDGDSLALTPNNTYKIAEVISTHSVAVNFDCETLVELPLSVPEPEPEPEPEPNTYTIVASVTSGDCSISPVGDVSVSEGSSQTFEVSTGAGNIWADIVVDGEWAAGNLGGASYTFSDVSEGHTISVRCYVPQNPRA